MPRLPTAQLGPHQITRLIVGGNPFCGNSHYSEELSREMIEFYTAERVKGLRSARPQFALLTDLRVIVSPHHTRG
jgi:hypothetical protein